MELAWILILLLLLAIFQATRQPYGAVVPIVVRSEEQRRKQ